MRILDTTTFMVVAVSCGYVLIAFWIFMVRKAFKKLDGEK